MRRLLLIIVGLILPALLLGGWLFYEQWPLWTAAHPGWLPEGAPGACAAVASLRAFNAERASEGAAVTPLEARQLAGRLTEAHYDLDAPPVYADPVLVRADFPNAGRRLAWLYTAALPGESVPPKAAVVYLDAENGGALALITGVQGGETCTLDLRALLRRAMRTTPALALAGYVGLVAVGGIIFVVYRRIIWRGKLKYRAA